VEHGVSRIVYLITKTKPSSGYFQHDQSIIALMVMFKSACSDGGVLGDDGVWLRRNFSKSVITGNLKSLQFSKQLVRALNTSARLSPIYRYTWKPQFTSVITHVRNMASLDDKSRALLQKAYPQTPELEGDMIKLSQSLFPKAEVRS
jgi:hypothetical protein